MKHSPEPSAEHSSPPPSLSSQSPAFHTIVSGKAHSHPGHPQNKGMSTRWDILIVGTFQALDPLPGKPLILWLEPECPTFFSVRCATRQTRDQLSAGRGGCHRATSHSAHHTLLGRNKLAGFSNKTILSPHVVLRKDISTSHTDPE